MSIQQAYQWAIKTCNAPNVGYSQNYRNQQTVNGITYYDCSSFINYSLLAGGYITPNYAPAHNAFTTGIMGSELLRLGAKKYSPTVAWKAGDILVAHNSSNEHTEMVYSGGLPNQGGKTMGAHTSKGALENQVSINTYVSTPTSPIKWDALYRFDGSVVPTEWIKGNRYLTLAEMQNNSIIVYQYFIQKGWTVNAIAGMLGNMQTESNINPWLWEGLQQNYSKGYGLTQWTPATKYINWAGSDWRNPDRELDRIQWEVDNNQQWFSNASAPIPTPPVNFKQFTQSMSSPSVLANYFLWYYEHPQKTDQPDRAKQAEYWYKFLTENPPVPPTPTKKKRKMPVWLMSKRPSYYIVRR